MNSRDGRWVHGPAAILLTLTALAKLYSSGGNARVLLVQDELLHLGYRPLMIGTAVVELGVAIFLLTNRSELKRSLVLLWLSANFAFYHLGNFLLGVHLCPCLGRLTDRLPFPRGFAEIMLQVLVLYWCATSLSSVWQLWAADQWARICMRMRGLLGRPAAASR